jgi:hypothetical protein
VAFPGALGFGKKATGGRGYGVYHVTNLNDTGTGSFRDAVSAGNRIVVFDVGGYINLKSPVSVKSNLTIAGQTAPGDGVGVMAGEVSYNASTNVITRYFRFRQGLLDSDSSKSGINLLDASNLIFDHISIEFAQWNNIDASNKNSTMTNITVQNSINANPTGQQFGAHTEQTGDSSPGTATSGPTLTVACPWPSATPSSSITWSTTTSTPTVPGTPAGCSGTTSSTTTSSQARRPTA